MTVMLCGGIAIGWTCAFGCASKTGLDMPLMEDAAATIQHNYVDRPAVSETNLTYGAIEGMVNSLGDYGHSTFLSPEMLKELKDQERGEFKGIGIEIRMKDNQVVVVSPLDGSPAQRAGFKAGDVILKVDGADIGGWPLSRVVGDITGPAGSKVRITLLEAKTGKTRDVTVTRASIKINNVTWVELPGTKIVHLRIASFNRSSARDLRAALKEIKATDCEGIVLDLRNNPGGLLDQAVDGASEFLKGGNVLLVKDANGKVSPTPAKHGGLATNIPLVVLVNQGSASGAEIVAGALRDTRGATLVGETTFGTGTVLGEFHLGDGSAMLLAIQEWLTPKGQSFWHKGITPQVQVALPENASPEFPETERTMTAEELQSSPDRQLLRALEILKSEVTSPSERATAGQL